MNDELSIKVNAVSKKYCKSLKRSMFYGIKDISKNMLGLSSRSDTLRQDEFWALDNVSFELKKGETLGIIGPNGAGKTTLLKMLNGIFWPDKGKISVNGRVGALIEVGAGFHPLLTGKENIYVNAAILGMTKKETDDKFESIVDFAGIGDFINTPVKFYSSGMFVRLGFAVAAHCEPDILLIDEVLAVGDLSFLSKSLEKMKEIYRSGKSIIFISHSCSAVHALCRKVIWLDNGKIVQLDEPGRVIASYVDSVNKRACCDSKAPANTVSRSDRRRVSILGVGILDSQRKRADTFLTGEAFSIQIRYKTAEKIRRPTFGIWISSAKGITVAGVNTINGGSPEWIEGEGVIECHFDSAPLMPDLYFLDVFISDADDIVNYVSVERAAAFNIRVSDISRIHRNYDGRYGFVHMPCEWRRI